MGTPRKINAILLNIKINRPKLVNVCRYELKTCWENFTEIYLTRVKISQKVLGGGATFLTHTVCVVTEWTCTIRTHDVNSQFTLFSGGWQSRK